MNERSEQERVALLESRNLRLDEDIEDIKARLDRLDNKLENVKDLLSKQAVAAQKELAKRPSLSAWVSILITLFGLIGGAYTYTWMEASRVNEDFAAIEARIKAAEDLSYGVIGRLNTIDKKLIWLDRTGRP